MALGVGQRLAQFRIDTKLGEGGMGVVYRAFDESLRRHVALKVLPEERTADEEGRLRLLREARSAAAVAHPNLVSVYEAGEDGGRVYVAMELVDGESLRDRMARGLLEVSEVLRIVTQVARGLAELHRLGIVHRDLKPENVMLTHKGGVKILDFGLAKTFSTLPATGIGEYKTAAPLTAEGVISGTPGYMSPEQLEGDSIDGRSDVFSFGVLLYELLTGVLPFRGRSKAAMIASVLTARAEPPSACAPSVSSTLDELVSRCLEKRPDHRYPSAVELVAELDAVSSTSIPADAPPRRLPPATRGTPWRGRLRILALAALVTIAVGLAALSLRRGTAGPRLAAGSASNEAVPTAVTLLALPPPHTTNLKALAEYAEGIQGLHDDNLLAAAKHFEAAAAQDPNLALVQLRLAMAASLIDESLMRDAFGKAIALRSQLAARELDLLDALEPLMNRLTPDSAEAHRRLETAAERHPRDVEFLIWIAYTTTDRDPEARIAVLDRATLLDPQDGRALAMKVDPLILLGRSREAREVSSACVRLAPDSTNCLEHLSILDANEGRCQAYEDEARTLWERDPEYYSTYVFALIEEGRPRASVREVFEQGIAREPDAARQEIERSGFELALVLVDADFARAIELARHILDLFDSSESLRSNLRLRGEVTSRLAAALHEMGRVREEHLVAADFVQKSEAMRLTPLSLMSDPVPELARKAVGSDGIPVDTFSAIRDRWVDQKLSVSEAYPGQVWVQAYAATARTADEAREALAQLPRFAPISTYHDYGMGVFSEWVGRTFVLAGRAEEALPYLKQAAAACVRPDDSMSRAPILRDLGEALEATGDKTGACNAYKGVIDLWGRARPRSVTAEQVRARRRALGCSD